MRRCSGFRDLSWFRLLACVALLGALAACGSNQGYKTATRYHPERYYPPPGPPSDPWGPYIREASARFSVPENWIRQVMRQESGGQEDVVSWAGAIGLMQLMPETYDELRDRYSLGRDPFNPHDNILAGTAYIREMYDRFGSPGFLAAYNAGPKRLDRYLNDGEPLPHETVNYVASIAPRLDNSVAMTGPLAVYGGRGRVMQVAARMPMARGCDPDAAYNPNGPCTPLRPAAATMARAPLPICDPDAAYDPDRPCRTVPMVEPPRRYVAEAQPRAVQPQPRVVQAVRYGGATPVRYAVQRRPLQETMGPSQARYRGARFERVAYASPNPRGHWMIQVGAFSSLSTAESVAERARSAAPELLAMTNIELPATVPFGNHVAFRARLEGLTAHAAAEACSRLEGRGMACMTVPPNRAAN